MIPYHLLPRVRGDLLMKLGRPAEVSRESKGEPAALQPLSFL